MANYRGYKLSCDSTLITGVEKAFNDAAQTIADKAKEVKGKVDELIEYAATDPSVSTSISSTSMDGPVTEVGTVITETMTKLKGIIAAINDYSDGKWADDNNRLFLDEFLKNSAPPGGYPSNPGTPPPATDPTITNEEQTPSELGTDESPYNEDYQTIGSEIVVSTSTPYTNTENSEYFVPSVPLATSISGTDTTNNVNDEIATENLSGSFSSFRSGNFGSGNFSVPTISTKKADGVKSSGVIGISGIAAAATLALGGKILYSKNKESEEDEYSDEEDDIDATVIQMGEETSTTNLNEGFTSGLNIVDFKNIILEEKEEA